MHQEQLLQPTLSANSKMITKSYEISNLFYVAFFGGIIPLLVLGGRNARWLRVDEKMVKILVGIGIAILVSKFLLVFSIALLGLEVKGSYKIISKASSVLLFFAFYHVMKAKFQQYQILVGETQPLLKDGIIWSAIGMLVEGGILLTGGMLYGYLYE
jgi:hypothetical protein